MLRFLRPLRTLDAKRARATFRRALDLGLPDAEQVTAALIARAVGKRAGLADDADVTKALTTAAAKDDSAGRLARFGLGQIDANTLVQKAGSPRKVVAAKLAIALQSWAANAPSAKSDLEAVAHADVVPAIESELAIELLEPAKGSIPGVVAPKTVAGL
jgi:hypothetical protein